MLVLAAFVPGVFNHKDVYYQRRWIYAVIGVQWHAGRPQKNKSDWTNIYTQLEDWKYSIKGRVGKVWYILGRLRKNIEQSRLGQVE